PPAPVAIAVGRPVRSSIVTLGRPRVLREGAAAGLPTPGAMPVLSPGPTGSPYAPLQSTPAPGGEEETESTVTAFAVERASYAFPAGDAAVSGGPPPGMPGGGVPPGVPAPYAEGE